MTPIGYLRKVEKFALYLRDTPEAERTDAHIDMICEAIDLAWKELSHDDKLVVYNTVQFVHQNIKPKSTLEKAADAVEPKPLIQLLH